MKTYPIAIWLMMLPEDIAEKALKNFLVQNQYGYDFLSEAESFTEAISWAFIWSKTEEGLDYWKRLARKYYKLIDNENT